MSGVIFEGADASGKSTLAREIHRGSGRALFLAGGKPKDDDEMWRMIAAQRGALEHGQLVDRVSSISQQVYREGLFMRADLMDEVRLLVAAGHLIVYCRPPEHIMVNPKYHEWKAYDTDEWKTQILSHQRTYIQRYDFLMTKFPCIVYDWTSEEGHVIKNLLMSMHQPGVERALRDMVKGGHAR